ncbi:DEAD/DEAH box helicase [Alteromonas sp. 5E99-2]|uniref:DEAD/DEAH box helicase n=1 Tax=Alteromonas sp. 5E99-2 TaxID=2817683 RepID=UPI001A9909FC|nr:DEAD/DEAH box helicase [Alteromonas sp. 5E99-2]MBO1256051.1 DEAD/DEAH box helicase [Alteromonas sp. 5E99-2]
MTGPTTTFSALGLCDELLQSVAEKGYDTPSEIQIEAVPAILSERDVMAVAQTGTGKTASFVLPILHLIHNAKKTDSGLIRALIIAPTRELAAQVATSVEAYSKYTNLRSFAVFGGVRIESQLIELQKGLDILVATPGRLLDLYNNHSLSFDDIAFFVLDEADRMLELGFIDDIRHIQTLLPKQRQTLLFSATFSKEIKSLAQGMLKQPISLEIKNTNNNINTITQMLHPVEKERKTELLRYLIEQHKWHQLLIFIKTKRDADALRDTLGEAGISAESIHANRTQHARTKALEGFKQGTIQVLVATDIAARGIDINQLPCVINYNLPYVPEDYVHRIGRTGRASAEGLAITLFSEDEAKQLRAIERSTGRQFKRHFIPAFAPPKKVIEKKVEDDGDLYGHFEADINPKKKAKGRGRKRRGR